MTTPPQFPPFPPWPEPAVTGLVDVTDEPIVFTPVPRRRKHRNGWTPEAQRAFIAALEECGCLSRAARAVGMSPRSVYRLIEAEGADSFAAAVDQAIARGVDRVRGEAMLRALHGSWVPVVRRGRVVRGVIGALGPAREAVRHRRQGEGLPARRSGVLHRRRPCRRGAAGARGLRSAIGG